MVGTVLKSALKAGIDKIQGKAINAQALPNTLKKAGVKPEELKFSGIELPTSGKVSKESLQELEASRTDVFGVTDGGTAFSSITINKDAPNATYRENVYTFAEGSEEASRFTSVHFPGVDNYLMHTRTKTETIGGKATRVVEEIQSDLHQAARKQGGYGDSAVPDVDADATLAKLLSFEFDSTPDSVYMQEVRAIYESALGRPVATINDEVGVDLLANAENVDDVLAAFRAAPEPRPPVSPYKDSWLSKGIEREIAIAIDAGQEQIAIPIKGAVDNLKRNAGDANVQEWYETSVLGTIQKIARHNKMDFKMVTESKPVDAQAMATKIVSAAQTARVKGVASIDVTKQLVKEFPTVPAADITRIAKAESIEQGMRTIKALNLVDSVDYAVITPTAGLRPTFSLYSVDVGVALMAFKASENGFGLDEITAKLIEQGSTEEEAKAIASQAAEAVKAGYTEKEITEFLTKKEPQIETVTSATPRVQAFADSIEPESGLNTLAGFDPEDNPVDTADYFDKRIDRSLPIKDLSPEDLVIRLRLIAPGENFLTTSVAAFAGIDYAHQISENNHKQANSAIIAMAKARGMELFILDDEGQPSDIGEFYTMTEQGPARVNEGFWKTVQARGGEALGAIAGGIAGAKYGANIPGNKLLNSLGGSIIGAAGGSIAGAQLDYIQTAVELQEELSSEIMARKVLTAAEASIVGDVIGFGVFKVVGKSWKHIVKLKRAIQNSVGEGRAKQALKEQLFITDETVDELYDKLSQVASVPGKTRTDKDIAAAVLTRPGAENIVKASTSIDAQASAAVSKAIDNRAQDLLKTAAAGSDEHIGKLLKGEFEAYTRSVKENFARVKAIPANSPRADAFRFKYDRLALDPVLERLGKNIENPDVAYKFMKQAEKIRDMSSTRSFSDLLELRQLINDFKFNKRISNTKDFNMLNKVLGNIDATINHGAAAVLDNPKAWLSSYRAANSSYGVMKKLEKNVLVKVLNRPGVDEKAIAKALTKYSISLDDTFVKVLEQLPRRTTVKVEGAIIESLANKYTAGLYGSQRAVHFPMLATELQSISFTSPEARVTKKAILRLAEVFKNDIPLAQAVGNIQIPRDQSYLTTDAVQRLHYEAMSAVFSIVKSLVPGKKSRALQLVMKTAKVLENPVNSKSINELIKEFGPEVNIAPLLEELAQEAAKRKSVTGSIGMPKIVMYGDGKVLSASGKGAKQSVPMHRIATIKEVQEIAEATGIGRADRKALDQALRDRGYSAIQLGSDSIRRITDAN